MPAGLQAGILTRMTIHERLGDKVRFHREKRGWSQERLAEVAGLHRTYISSLEHGRRNATLSVIERLANALEVSATDLLGDDA